MTHSPDLSKAAAALGRKGGQSTSERKAAAARENGKRGGRPKKSQGDDRMKSTAYIYSNETNEHVATIEGNDDRKIQEKFEDMYGSNDYSITYSPAFGFSSGLVENPDAEYIKA